MLPTRANRTNKLQPALEGPHEKDEFWGQEMFQDSDQDSQFVLSSEEESDEADSDFARGNHEERDDEDEDDEDEDEDDDEDEVAISRRSKRQRIPRSASTSTSHKPISSQAQSNQKTLDGKQQSLAISVGSASSLSSTFSDPLLKKTLVRPIGTGKGKGKGKGIAIGIGKGKGKGAPQAAGLSPNGMDPSYYVHD